MISKERYSSLSLLYIENKIAKKINYYVVVFKFGSKKTENSCKPVFKYSNTVCANFVIWYITNPVTDKKKSRFLGIPALRLFLRPAPQMLEPTLFRGVSYTTVFHAKMFSACFVLLELLPFQEVNLQVPQINLLYSRFEIFTALQMRNLLFSDMWPRHWVVAVVWKELPYLDKSETVDPFAQCLLLPQRTLITHCFLIV